MDIDPALVSVASLAVVAAVLLSPFVLSRLRSKEENGLSPLYEEWCSVRRSVGFGIFAGGNMPFWRVSLYNEFMVIKMFSPTLIPYSEVEHVEHKHHLLSKAVYIDRRAGSKKESIVVFTRHAEKLAEILKSKVHAK